MKIVEPKYEIRNLSALDEMEKDIEWAARTCYISKENKSARDAFIKKLIDNEHEAMLEHSGVIKVKFTCDRGISHELVRHRMASFAQESTRWCNYANDRFGNEITVIRPYYIPEDENDHKHVLWKKAMMQAEESYIGLLNAGCSAQEARAVLPNSLKTEIIVTANVREWRHIFKLRCASDAHPQMKELMIPLLCELRSWHPSLFWDIPADWEWFAHYLGYEYYRVERDRIIVSDEEGCPEPETSGSKGLKKEDEK